MSWQDGTADALPPGVEALSTDSLALEPLPSSVPRARRFVAEQTRDLPAAVRETASLLCSELVTNAVIHARTDLVVAVVLAPEHVAVTVHDLDLGRREQGGEDRDGGRGLTIVQALSCASGQHVHPRGGKTSWFRLCRAPHDPGPGA